MKTCSYCKETKDIDSFAISKTFYEPLKISSRCKICLNAIAKTKRTKNEYVKQRT